MTRFAVSLWLSSALLLFGCTSANTGHVTKDMAVGNDLATSSDGGPGGGVLVITPPSVAFGASDCGGASPSPQAVTLTNTGTGSFAFTASLDSAQFYFASLPAGDTLDDAGNLNGTIAAGASQVVSLGSLGVPASATAALDLVGNLSVVVFSGPTAQTPAPLQVPLSVTPFGVTVVVTPMPPAGSSVNYNFGAAPMGSPVPAPTDAVQLVNFGNDTVAVTLGVASDGEYSASVPGGSMLVGGTDGSPGEAVSVTASFDANTINGTQATIPILIVPADAPVCGQSATTITLAGQGSTGNLSPSTTTLSWTPSCGTAAGGTGLGTKTVTLTNSAPSAQPLTIALASAGGAPSGFAVSPTGAQSVPANGQLVLTVTPPAASSLNGVTPITDAVTLSYTDSSGNNDVVPIAVAVDPQGAILELQLIGGAAPPLPFGVVPLAKSATAQLQIVNTGNVTATGAMVVGSVTGKSTGSFSAPVGAVTVAANNTLTPLTIDATYTAPSALPMASVAETGQFTIVDSSDVVCNMVAPLAATATATTGAVTVTPPQLIFTGPGTGAAAAGRFPGANLPPPRAGAVYCDTRAGAQTATVSNYAAASATITGWTFGNGTSTSSAYTVTMSPASGVVAANGTATITITPVIAPTALPVDPDLGDTLTVSVQTAAGTQLFPLQLVQVVTGAVLTNLTPSPVGQTSTLAFGNTPAGSKSTIALDLVNTGNVNAQVSCAPIPSPTNGFGVPAGAITIVAGAGGAPPTFQAIFQPSVSAAPGTVTAQSSLQTRATPLCDALGGGAVSFPITLALSGTIAKAANFAIAPNPITFTQACGAAAGAAQKVTITAGAKGTFSWAAVIIGGSSNLPAGAFTPTPASGTVTNGTQATMDISPVTIASATSVAAPTYTATLQVTITVGATMTVYTVPITETASGVIIAANPTSIAMNAPGFSDFSVYNAGTPIGGVTFTAALGTAVDGTFMLSAPISAGGQQYYTVTAGKVDKGSTMSSDTINVTVTPSTNGNPPAVCNAGGKLSIPVVASVRAGGGPIGP